MIYDQVPKCNKAIGLVEARWISPWHIIHRWINGYCYMRILEDNLFISSLYCEIQGPGFETCVYFLYSSVMWNRKYESPFKLIYQNKFILLRPNISGKMYAHRYEDKRLFITIYIVQKLYSWLLCCQTYYITSQMKSSDNEISLHTLSRF